MARLLTRAAIAALAVTACSDAIAPAPPQGPTAPASQGGAAQEGSAAGPPTDAPTAESAIVWQGFNHEWKYENHRLNQLGDFVTAGTQGTCDSFTHVAASGSSADEAIFTSHATRITTSSAAFKVGSKTLHFVGTRTNEIRLPSLQINEDAPATMQGKGKYTAIINGFQLLAANDAMPMKVQSLDIHLDPNVAYDATTRTMQFKLETAIAMDCRSAECVAPAVQPPKPSGWVDVVDYTMEVFYLLVAGDAKGFDATSTKESHSYSWTAQDEISIDDPNQKLTRTLVGRTGFNAGTLGFNRIAFALHNTTAWPWGTDSTTHLLQLAPRISEPRTDPTTGTTNYALSLFFKAWKPRMRQPTAFATSGSADFSATVTLLQFANATVRPTTSGEQAMQGGATGVQAVPWTRCFPE